MKLHYYPETDSLYIEFRSAPSAETREIQNGVNVDLGSDVEIVGFDIDNASAIPDLSTQSRFRSSRPKWHDTVERCTELRH